MAQGLVAQAYHVFFARQHRKRIAGSRFDDHQLDRVRTDIDGSDLHVRGFCSGAFVAAARSSAELLGSGFAASFKGGSDTVIGSMSTTFLIDSRKLVATRFTGRDASITSKLYSVFMRSNSLSNNF